MLSTLPGGLAIDRYSIRHLLMISVLLLSAASFLVPLFAAEMGPAGVILLRFLMGVGEGVMIPGINGMITGWIPLHEKSTAASVFTSGNQLAGILGNPIAAELCASDLQWPAVFYCSGLLGFLWCVVWHYTVNNSPSNSKWISDHELAYLEHHLPEKRLKHQKCIISLNFLIVLEAAELSQVIPWLSMASSAPLLVVFYSGIIGNMMIAMILVYIPVYFKDVLMLEVKQNGFYTALPHTFNLISKLVWGFSMDYFKQKKLLTATQTVKLSQVLSMLTLSICFFALAYGVDCSTHGLALFLLSVIGAAFGLSISGFLTSLLSLAPNFIGVISSISQIIGNGTATMFLYLPCQIMNNSYVAGFGGRVATPQIITYFKTVGTAEEWRGILLVYSAMTALSAALFAVWGSGEVQYWNSPQPKCSELGSVPMDSKQLVINNEEHTPVKS
ncbi:transporter, major facilitator family protein [Necator americanus]|uniref:Transporter, major facilitator family protein n=1 Tax=Necator americanus TaxID=51031 RepID=W2TQY9_NECAM|nr:transporter, major facilitator family protein [Necator americanus]ETN83536.1 transporter, major facilitator family protein [Necator americanus]